MKSYKQRTLDAQLDLIRRYKKNDPPDKCPFCEIYEKNLSCLGCFMADGEKWGACMRFSSYISSINMWIFSKGARLARAAFHRKVYKINLKRPAKYFTPSKWKYLDIPREW